MNTTLTTPTKAAFALLLIAASTPVVHSAWGPDGWITYPDVVRFKRDGNGIVIESWGPDRNGPKEIEPSQRHKKWNKQWAYDCWQSKSVDETFRRGPWTKYAPKDKTNDTFYQHQRTGEVTWKKSEAENMEVTCRTNISLLGKPFTLTFISKKEAISFISAMKDEATKLGQTPDSLQRVARPPTRRFSDP